MKPNEETDERIPMFVESQRGDDRIGTDPGGNLITDHAASEARVAFESGVPQAKIQEAVEKELKDGKWVVVEKKNGSSDLLTRADIPEHQEEEKEEEVLGEEPVEKEEDNIGAPGEVRGDDWRKAFTVVPAEPKKQDKPVAGPVCTVVPKKDKEVWKSRFADVKSATATHKGKGG